MKSGIHPKWNHQATVTCGCGNKFLTGSASDALTVDVCSACHPFYTGKMKFLDTQGRVERFMNKRKASAGYVSKKKSDAAPKESLSLREMLEVEKKKLAATESKPAAKN